MSLIRKIEIVNFRGIANFSWLPSLGINCLIGPGDSGKSSILDAIDLCLGARRNIQITDADFHDLNVNVPIQVTITIGSLDDALKNIDTYGLYLRAFNSTTGEISEEPEVNLETVLTVQLTIESDLEPNWTLVSERAIAQNQSRNINWMDRVRLSPTRLGAITEHNLSWRHGSILNRVSEQRVDASEALIKAAREVRATFGDKAKSQLGETLEIVTKTARDLGIPVGSEVKAMLDAHSVSFSGGTVSLHNENGVPLRGLGLGSTRLLIAGLQRYAAKQASIILIDELEHGLEPHRIIRLLDALGAKEKTPPLQVFMTTHSPVAVRELSGDQLFVVRQFDKQHEACLVGSADEVQGTIRRYPEALLAQSVIVCEGASEVGLLRGLDQFRTNNGETSITACGVAIVDGGGHTTFKRARAFQSLGYRTAVLRDNDIQQTPELEAEFKNKNGLVFYWRGKNALEDELFLSLSNSGVNGLLQQAIEMKEDKIVNEHIKTASGNAKDLDKIVNELKSNDGIQQDSREILSMASKNREARKSWFKSISAMEVVARDVIGPDLKEADSGFKVIIDQIFEWIQNAK